MHIHEVLADFAASEVPGAIVLQGRWGIGKTYFWRHKVLPLIFEKPGKKRHSYVSLFGINSLAELKTALAVATEEADEQAKHDEQLLHRMRRKLNLGQPFAKDAVSFIPSIGAELARLVENLGYLMIRDRIICFDDIERRGDGLALKDFMGLVSYLVDQRRCRIVVILNTGELGEQQLTWDRMREKVFDGEFTYMPSIEETIDLGLSDSAKEPWAKALRDSLFKLSISNIRLVHRTVKFMRRVFQIRSAADLRPHTVEHIAKAMALLVYSVHGQGEGAPPIDLLMQDQSSTNSSVDEEKQNTFSRQELDWQVIFEEYDIHLHTTLDEALLEMVQNGYPDADRLRAAIDEIENDAAQTHNKDAFRAAWTLYHHTTAENGAEIVDAFERTWPPISKFENVQNLAAISRILRLLGRADLATRFINQWVYERSSSNHREITSAELHRFGKIDDAEILDAVAKLKEMPTKQISLQEAFEEIRKSPGYPRAAIKRFSAATEAEIQIIIDSNPGEELRDMLRKLNEIPRDSSKPGWIESARLTELACRHIAARSPLNADRINNWVGLDPYQDMEDQIV